MAIELPATLSGACRNILAVVVIAAVAAPSAADVVSDPGVSAMPCRPTVACTADIVPPGVLELEAGYLYRRLGNAANQSSAPFLLKLTVTEWLQLQLGSNGPTVTSEPSQARYLDDVVAGVKLHVLDQSPIAPSIALSAVLGVPTFEATGYTRTYDALGTVYVTKDLGWLHADWNLGGSVLRVERSPQFQAWTALALSIQLPRGFTAMLEGYYFSDAPPLAPRDGGLLAAVGYQPRKLVVVDAGVDLGLVRATRAASAFVGVTLVLAELWDAASAR